MSLGTYGRWEAEGDGVERFCISVTTTAAFGICLCSRSEVAGSLETGAWLGHGRCGCCERARGDGRLAGSAAPCSSQAHSRSDSGTPAS